MALNASSVKVGKDLFRQVRVLFDKADTEWFHGGFPV
jgi:hypothetical protein